ncbi:uncharacterized protein LOC134778034 [Penaeus indicus]|uniref:uncharacterized protein LOC134778034 n=1 Tax=Penaeus indicus TaxID=29960 RepID=UPI00300D5C67
MARGLEGKLEGQVLRTLAGASLAKCVAACRVVGGCKGFNRQRASGTCDLLATRLCENDILLLSSAEADWRYFDMQDASYPDPSHVFFNHSMCTERGMCSSACERGIDQSCTDNIQCQAATENSYCTAASPSSPGVCRCNTHYWKYNATLCIHQTSLDSSIWSWIFKKVVNNMCYVTFTARVKQDIWIHLGSYEDWHSGITQYYFILGGWGNTQSILDRDGTRMVTAATEGLCTNNYQNFTLYWCNGNIRVSLTGVSTFIAWDDPAPFTVNTLGFRMPYTDGHAHIFFPHNLVDPYFPTSVETGGRCAVLEGVE